jgi:predicted amidohydrolase
MRSVKRGAGETLRIIVAQTRPHFGEVERNVTEALRLVDLALERGGGRADLVILPELFHTGYVFTSRAEARALAEDPRKGPTALALAAFAKARRLLVVAGFCEKAGRVLHNSAIWVDKRGTRGVYRKVHLFDSEKHWFAPGRDPWPVFRCGPAKVGILICFDWRFPEAARSLALRGADVLAHPSNLVLPHCQESMRTRALENRVFAATANRVGEDLRPGGVRLAFTGRSQVVDPTGRVLWRAGSAAPAARLVALDLTLARDKRVTERNDLFSDRVPGLYRSLVQKR